MTIDGSALGAANSLIFDGSAELDGSYVLKGGAGADLLRGGSGADRITGGLGQDTLIGGSGADSFVYGKAAESTGANYDTLTDFDAASDKVDLQFAVKGIDPAITMGNLSTATFDSDLSAGIGTHLAAKHALLFTPSAGSLANHAFLVVDANGVAGYQAGADFVIDVTSGQNLASLSTSDFV